MMAPILQFFLLISIINIFTLTLYESFGQGVPSTEFITEKINKWIDKTYAFNQQKYGNHPEFFVKRGVLADRKRQKIEILGVATGLTHGEPVEFLLVSENGKDYESIAVTPAIPSDIISAIEFIGLKQGHPFNPAKRHFWPKGERVFMTYRWDKNDLENSFPIFKELRAEELVIDVYSKKPLPNLGFRFVGSTWQNSVAPKGPLKCQADLYGEIVAIFNSSWTVFEIPYKANQKVVYGTLFPNPDCLLKKHQRILIHINPEYMDGTTRVRDYSLHLELRENSEPKSLERVIFSLSSNDGKHEYKKGEFLDILAFLKQTYQKGKEPYVRIKFGQSISASIIREFCLILKAVLEKGFFFIEPDDHHLYFEAFLPQETWRNASKRSSPNQPVEVQIHNKESFSTITGGLIQFSIAHGNGDDSLNLRRIKFEGEAGLLKYLKAGKPWRTSGIFLVVDADFPYGLLQQLYKKIKEDFHTVFVFIS